MGWRAYAALEPFGAVREDQRIGSLQALYYNAHRGKRDRALQWHDFLSNAERPEPKTINADQLEKMFGEFNKRFEVQPPARTGRYQPAWKGKKR